MHERVAVVMPTYNEAANIDGIVRATLAELERVAPDRHSILIVDDSSPDGTGEMADALARELPAVQALHRTAKTGLGHAYIGHSRGLSTLARTS